MDYEPGRPEVYDFRQHDRLWQRVQPGLEPYPEATPPQQNAGEAPQALPPAGLSVTQEGSFPGAEPDPCCMGTEAAELLAVLEGYIGEEAEERRRYLALSRQAPAWARQPLRELAEDEAGHVRRLMAARFLITGQCFRPRVMGGQLYMGDWCAALRQCYHQEACGGFNYARTADGTADVCLAKLLRELSEDEYRHAERVMELLERTLRG